MSKFQQSVKVTLINMSIFTLFDFGILFVPIWLYNKCLTKKNNNYEQSSDITKKWKFSTQT